MSHAYRTLAKIVLVYAAIHPVLYLSAQYALHKRIESRFESVLSGLPSEGTQSGASMRDAMDEGTREALVQHLLIAVLVSLGLAAVAAIFHIAAAVTELAARAEPAAG